MTDIEQFPEVEAFLSEMEKKHSDEAWGEPDVLDLVMMVRAVMALPRYIAADTDNSCRDPDCCGGPYPCIELLEYDPAKMVGVEDDELCLKLSDIRTALQQALEEKP